MQIIDWVLIGLYMIFMVAIGAYFKTSSSMSDYAVADKKLGLSVLVATFLATGVGGGVLTGSTGNGLCQRYSRNSQAGGSVLHQHFYGTLSGKEDAKHRRLHCS